MRPVGYALTLENVLYPAACITAFLLTIYRGKIQKPWVVRYRVYKKYTIVLNYSKRPSKKIHNYISSHLIFSLASTPFRKTCYCSWPKISSHRRNITMEVTWSYSASRSGMFNTQNRIQLPISSIQWIRKRKTPGVRRYSSIG